MELVYQSTSDDEEHCEKCSRTSTGIRCHATFARGVFEILSPVPSRLSDQIQHIPTSHTVVPKMSTAIPVTALQTISNKTIPTTTPTKDSCSAARTPKHTPDVLSQSKRNGRSAHQHLHTDKNRSRRILFHASDNPAARAPDRTPHGLLRIKRKVSSNRKWTEKRNNMKQNFIDSYVDDDTSDMALNRKLCASEKLAIQRNRLEPLRGKNDSGISSDSDSTVSQSSTFVRNTARDPDSAFSRE